MGLYVWLNNAFQKINKVCFPLNGNTKEIGRVYTFINGERVLLHPDAETLVYQQNEPGVHSYNLTPGKYRIEVSGSGGLTGMGISTPANAHGGAAELITQEVTVENTTTLQIIVAGRMSGGSIGTGAFGAVNGQDGQRIQQGSMLLCAGGGGGGQSQVLSSSADINITANGGGGRAGIGGDGTAARGGDGSGGATGGTSATYPNGQDAGNGLGAPGVGDGVSAEDANGWVKIYIIG